MMMLPDVDYPAQAELLAAVPAPAAAIYPLSAITKGAVTPKVILAFGFDDLVEGYRGATFTIKRLSDNTSKAFSFNIVSKQANLQEAITWAQGEADMVNFIDQKGSGKLLNSIGKIPFARKGVVLRQQIEAALSGQNKGFITPDNTKGDASVDISSSGNNYFECADANLSAKQGLEVHLLMSPKTRKFGSASLQNTIYEPAAWKADVNAESLFGYGNPSTRGTQHSEAITNISQSSAIGFRRFPAVGTNFLTANFVPSTPIKQWASQVLSFVSNNQSTEVWRGGDKVDSLTTTPQLVTDDTNLTYKQFRVGRQIAGAFNEANTKGNFLFSGVLITSSLSPAQRREVHQRWADYARYYLLKSPAWVTNQFFDYLLFKKATAAGLPGEKKRFNLSFNQTPFNGQTPSWQFQFTATNGLQGLNVNTFNNMANQFEDVGALKVGGQNREGTLVTVIQTDPTYDRGDNLTDVFAYTASPTVLHKISEELPSDLRVQFDHIGFSNITQAQQLDPKFLTERRGPAYTNKAGVTTQFYNGVNHPFFYRYKLMTRAIAPENDALYDNLSQSEAKTWMAANGELQQSKQGEFGANLSPLKGQTYVIIQTWKPHPKFNEQGTPAEIEQFIGKADKTITVALLNNPSIGGLDGFYANEDNLGASRIPLPNSRLVAHADDKRTFVGTRHFFGVINRVLTPQETASMIASIGQIL